MRGQLRDMEPETEDDEEEIIKPQQKGKAARLVHMYSVSTHALHQLSTCAHQRKGKPPGQ